MTKVYGLTVGKNEAGRYLESMLAQVSSVVDEVYYYDDQSSDNSLGIAMSFPNVHSTVRPDGVPSFVQHEGKFRQDAWDMMQSVLPMTEMDWVLAIDTDELLVSNKRGYSTRETLDEAINAADNSGCTSVILPIPEVWGYADDGHPLVRMDGMWGGLRGYRLFKYKIGGTYAPKGMGCGAEPIYVSEGKQTSHHCGLALMHFGYADKRDRETKAQRYSQMLYHGHNSRHINSILAPPQLKRWEGRGGKLIRAT